MKAKIIKETKGGVIFYTIEVSPEDVIEELALNNLGLTCKDDMEVAVMGVGLFYRMGSAHLEASST